MNTIVRDIIVAALSSSGVFAILVMIYKESIKSLIQNAIKHEFDQKLEDYKAKEVKRQKAILIADLISEWLSKSSDKKRLNQLSFEAFIWLPKETALKLSKLLTWAQDSPDIREVLAEVRELILGPEEKIDSKMIVLFPFTETTDSKDKP